MPYSTDGTGRTGGNAQLSGVHMCTHGTSHGIPVYHMVQMGWDGQVGMHSSLVYPWNIPRDPSVPHGTDGMGWMGGLSGVHMCTHGTSHRII